MKQKSKRYVSMLLAAIILSQSVAGVYATDRTVNKENTLKEEVVYGNLTAEGAVEGIYIVNSFQGVKGKTIVDYGNYTRITNLTTQEEIQINKGEITVATEADKLYYQGDLSTKVLPWKIGIQYQLEGKNYKAEEMGGKTGHMKMEISITQNTQAAKSFWESYALQISFQLDGEKFQNIQAKDATIASVGSAKQLSFICLPGKEVSLVVEADVTDFEMGEISINGTRLNLGLDVDSGKIDEEILRVQDAAAQVNNGAEKLEKGAGELSNGVKEAYEGSMNLEEGTNSLLEGSNSLLAGSNSLLEGSNSLQQGINELKQGIDTLNQKSGELTGGAGQLVSGLEELQTGMGTYQSTLQQQLEQAGISDINGLLGKHDALLGNLITSTQREVYEAYSGTISGGGDEAAAGAAAAAKLQELATAGDAEAAELLSQYTAAGDNMNIIAQYITNAGKLVAAETLLMADKAYISGSSGAMNQLSSGAASLLEGSRQLSNGIHSYTEGVSQAAAGLQRLQEGASSLSGGIAGLREGASSLSGGIASLQEGTRSMTQGMAELYDGSASLQEGSRQLQEGTGEFYDETRGMSDKVQNSIDETMDEMLGKNIPVESFASEKNTNVESVLFVLKTAPIKTPEVVVEEVAEEKELSWWEKFLALFN